ncbi:MAG: metallophosphoesterase [Oscillospiraceae bacterium]|nr:metallophosphoesterase [Oscillospiraceae bacterium]
MNKKLKWLIAGAVTAAVISGYCLWQNEDIGVSYYSYTSEKIGEDLNGCKIVHISDLHNKEFGSNSSRLVKLISNEQPDIIIISGDLVDSRRTDIEAALNFVSQIVEIAPVYYSTGNHEERLDPDAYAYLLSSLEEIGATVLQNETETVYINDESFVIFGLKDGTVDSLEDIYGDTDKLKLMIAHKPHLIDKYSALGADLVFSGHVHGGQVRIPFLGGLLSSERVFFPKYYQGVHQVNDTTLVISRGLGNSIIPIRINNRPELVVVTLSSK